MREMNGKLICDTLCGFQATAHDVHKALKEIRKTNYAKVKSHQNGRSKGRMKEEEDKDWKQKKTKLNNNVGRSRKRDWTTHHTTRTMREHQRAQCKAESNVSRVIFL